MSLSTGLRSVIRVNCSLASHPYLACETRLIVQCFIFTALFCNNYCNVQLNNSIILYKYKILLLLHIVEVQDYIKFIINYYVELTIL